MKTPPLPKLLGLALAAGGLLAQTTSALITIDTVPVGNAANAADPTTGYGTVGYNFRIGKYEVTLNQYTAFLNAVGATDTYGLYNTSMGSDPHIKGIARSGVSGSYTYSVIGSGNRPVTYVSWFDAARFVNWMHNGQPAGAQAAGITETGAYTLNGAMSGIIDRNPGWIYGLPTENEWYKAAYHQPAAQGGDSDDYWLYPTANNAIPNSRNGSDSDPNSANFFRDDGIANGFNGGYAVNNSSTYPAGNALTDVGAFSLADSFYGTFDQGGNVWEWIDAVDGSARVLRGSVWHDSDDFFSMRASFRLGGYPPTIDDDSVGFRIVVTYLSQNPPVITLSGDAMVTNECHATFTDPGATADGAPLAIAGGWYHNLALKSDGTVGAWGRNSEGQTSLPMELSNVVALAGGGHHSLALKSDRTVVAWGSGTNNTGLYPNYGQSIIPVGLSGVVAIAGGALHSLALKSDGTVAAWGYNGNGQTNVPVGLSNVVAIARGGEHNLALKSDGTVIAWGFNYYGQTNIPAGLSNVTAIAGGGEHSLALQSNGTIAAWGGNEWGQTNIPVGLSNVVAIAGGSWHSLALQSDGTVAAWGRNDYGQTNIPVGLSNVVAIAGGAFHSLALKSDGTVAAWGYDVYGLTNIPAGLSISLPVTVSGSVDTNTPGSYPLTYTATNILGGLATSTRTVVVQDTLPPVITMLGANPLTNMLNVPFIDPGATALDGCGGSLAVTTNSTVNIAMPGTYAVTYNATDGNGNAATSNRVVHVVVPPPGITSQPQSVSAGCGVGVASFSVTASGVEPLSYQWHFNGVVIPGATTTNHTVNPTTPDKAGGYTVVITNIQGAVTSSVVTLTLTNQTPTAIAADAFSLSAGGTLVIPPSALSGNDSAGACNGASTELTFLSFSPTSANGGMLASLPPGIPLWTNRYNGFGNINDIANDIVVDSGGNVIVTGEAYEGSTQEDYVTIKYSSAGVPLWTNYYNGLVGSADRAYAVAVDGVGNVFVTGRAAGEGFATVAYSSDGVALWTNRYFDGGSGTGGQDIMVSLGGMVLVTGTGFGDFVTLAYSADGMPLWTNRYDGPIGGNDEAQSLAVGPDGIVFVTGRSPGAGSQEDYATIAYSSVGVPLWTNRYDGPGNSYDYANAVAVDAESNVFVTGYSFNGLSYDYATVAYSGVGVPLWTNSFDGPASAVDRAYVMAVDADGNVFVAGYSQGVGTADDFAVVAYSGAGVPLWTNRYDGPANSFDSAEAVTADRSGNIIVTGHSFGSGGNYDYATVAYSAAGVPLWTNRYAGPADGIDQGAALAVDADGNVFVTGNSEDEAGWRDYATIAYSGNRIAYTPTNGFSGVDTFTYVMQDGYGLTHTGTVTIAVGVAVKKIAPKKLPGGAVELGFYGTPGAPYALERTFDLSSSAWSALQTNTAAANGAITFTNLPVGSANFWRIRAAP